MRVALIIPLFLLSLLTACSSVSVEKISKKSFKLTQNYNEPPNSLSSSAMEKKAWEVCPEGYFPDTKQAFKTAEFGNNYAECVDKANCDYVLEWQVTCSKRPKEKSSIFGNI